MRWFLNENYFLQLPMVICSSVLVSSALLRAFVFLCNILKQPEAYSVLLYISFLIFLLDSLIFLSVTLSHVDLAHGSGAHSSLTNKMLLVLCVHVVFAVNMNQNTSQINKQTSKTGAHYFRKEPHLYTSLM